jgi:hypothetical protein
MCDTAPILKKLLGGALGGLALVLGLVGTAQARGIVADMNAPATISACAVAPNCSAESAFAGTAFSNVYVYTDGAISIGAPSTNPTFGDLSTFGNSFIAAGLADYAALGFNVEVQYNLLNNGATDNVDPTELELYWVISNSDPTTKVTSADPLGDEQAIFGIYLSSTNSANFKAVAGSGVGDFTWFNQTGGYNPYCDAASTSDNICGVFLPNTAVTGSSYDGCQSEDSSEDASLAFQTCSQTDALYPNPPDDTRQIVVNSDYTYPTYILTGSASTTPVPEPATWMDMVIALGAMGIVVAKLRRRAALDAI